MRKALLILTLFCCVHASFSQASSDDLALRIPQEKTSSIPAIAGYIKQNFSSDSARVRGIYVWVANNISYDVARLKARDKDPNMAPQPVDDVLKTRSAVCQGYSELFVEICKQIGINATVVGGYTKQRGIVMQIPHAWVAVQLDGKWWLYDPTWGAGHVQDDKFVKAFNNRFYKLAPAEMIKDHMPFDPMYQFLNYPITNKDFIEGTTDAMTVSSKPVFYYDDTLKMYRALPAAEQVLSELRRIESMGVRNDLIRERVTFLRNRLQGFASKDSFTEGNDNMKRAIALFNEYINHKNKQFSTIEDAKLKITIDSISLYVKTARASYNSATPKNDAQRQALSNANAGIERFYVRYQPEKEFAEKYLSANAGQRRQMFGRR